MLNTDQKTIVYSFEFFPPKTTEGIANLRETRSQLAQYNPEFFSVTFGAGGSTTDRTQDTVFEIQAEGHQAAPHISCISSSKDEIRALLTAYQSNGIRRLVTLRGDVPSGEVSMGDFKYANELVTFIRQETNDWFHLEVAAYPEFHPEAASAAKDIANFKRKVEAGANSAITQYFFNSDAYFRFVDDAYKLGVDVPVVPGIMPITSSTPLMRFSDACGAEIPRWIRLRLQGFGDDTASIKSFGLDVTTDLCDQLRNGGVPGLHFYSMNQAGPTVEICQRLQLV